ncbi:hypothetical protein D7231_31790 [Streptomyces klenkii]|uniref:Phage tail tape measure protein n=1 Tax=Streptomyces klenkii TaxID=1420899 RepID=A0A3B0AQZ0_9ACTN|nr:hypothetical protein [Streptomyces klenkii]RKN61857.1 hypothetical protein D7231_31790 [Streptomyces klenkii]
MSADSVNIVVRASDDTRAGLAQVNRSIANLRQQARTAAPALTALGARATAAAAALKLLREEAQGASRELRTLRGRAAAAAAAINDVRTNSRSASTSLRTLSTRADGANARIGDLGAGTRRLKGDMDDLDGAVTKVAAGLTGLRGKVGTVTIANRNATQGMRRLRAAALLLSPALLPIAAAAAPIAAGLGAATVALTAFGVAAGRQVKHMADAVSAETAYLDAVEEHGRTTTEAAQAELAWHRELEQMPPAARAAAAELRILRNDYTRWSDSLARDTTRPLIHGMQTLRALFEPMTPLIQGSSRELDRWMALARGGIDTPGFDSFMSRFAEFSEETLSRARIGLIEFTQAAEAGDVGQDFREFMDYARQNSPLVADTLGNLTQVITNLLIGASDTGVSILGLVNALAQLASALPPDLIGALLSTYAALRLVRLGIAGVTAVATSGAIARLSAFVAAARMNGVGAALGGVAAGMSRVQKAMVALGGLALVAVGISQIAKAARGAPPDVDRLTTSLMRLSDTGEFTGELRQTFGDIDGLIEKIDQLNERAEARHGGAEGIFGFRIPLLDDLSDAIEGAVDDMAHGSTSLNALQDDFEGLDQALAGMASSGHADAAAEGFARIREAAIEGGHSISEINDLFPEYRATLEAVRAEQDLIARGMGLFGEQALRVGERLQEQRLSADGLRQSIVALNEVQRAGLGGMIAFEQAIDDAGAAAEENAGRLRMVDGELDLNSEAAREAATALQDLASRTDDAAAAARDNGESWAHVSEIYGRGREALIASAEQMGLTGAQARALAEDILNIPDREVMLRGDISDLEDRLREARDRLRRVPDSRKARVRADISNLEDRLREARRELNSLRDRTVTVYHRSIYSEERTYWTDRSGGRNQTARAHGGVVGTAAAGGPRSRMTLVGEHGPELVDLPAGSRVRSNPDSRRISAMGGGPAGPVVLELRSSGSRVDDMLLWILRDAIKVRGGDVQIVLGQDGWG